jgi:hypothetical protein
VQVRSYFSGTGLPAAVKRVAAGRSTSAAEGLKVGRPHSDKTTVDDYGVKTSPDRYPSQWHWESWRRSMTEDRAVPPVWVEETSMPEEEAPVIWRPVLVYMVVALTLIAGVLLIGG